MDLLPALVGLVVAALVLWLLFVAVVWLHRPSRELAGPLLRLLPDLFRLTRRVATDSRTPRSVRLALVGLSVWILSPIDLLPEFLPGIGPLDDIIVAVLVLRWSARRLGQDRLAELWPGTPEGYALLQRLL